MLRVVKPDVLVRWHHPMDTDGLKTDWFLKPVSWGEFKEMMAASGAQGDDQNALANNSAFQCELIMKVVARIENAYEKGDSLSDAAILEYVDSLPFDVVPGVLKKLGAMMSPTETESKNSDGSHASPTS